jgi:lysozyme family protein
MQSSWQTALAFTLQNEGGYTVDRGGPTMHGITLNTYRAITGNYALSATDLQVIPSETVELIYANHFWSPMCCPALPEGIDLMVFDAGVMSGVQNSIYLLQRAVGATVDGNLGPRTLAAINALSILRAIELLRLQQWRFYGQVHDASAELVAAWRARLARRAWAANDLVHVNATIPTEA